MPTYTVKLNDTPASIATQFTGRPERMNELFPANAEKKLVGLGSVGHSTFESLNVGEVITLPESWVGLGAAGLGACPTVVPMSITAATAALETTIAAARANGNALCSGPPYTASQDTCNFQAAYNATNPTAPLPTTTNAGTTVSTLAVDGDLGPATLAALNYTVASKGYSYACTNGFVLSQTTVIVPAPTPNPGPTPTPTPTPTPGTPPAAGSNVWLILGLVAAGGAGAYYFMRHKPGSSAGGSMHPTHPAMMRRHR